MSDVVIVTGSRDWADAEFIGEKLGDALPKLIVQGGCPTGADAIARDWARENGVRCVTFNANWLKHGRAAGPLRNGLMLRSYPDALVMAFPLDGPGTWDCIRQAKTMGMLVRVYSPTREATDVPSLERARRRKEEGK